MASDKNEMFKRKIRDGLTALIDFIDEQTPGISETRRVNYECENKSIDSNRNEQTAGSSKRRRINYACEPTIDGSCTYPDVQEKKKWKHTKYFCPYQTKCGLCYTKPNSLERHYLENHPYETKEYIKIKPLANGTVRFTLKQDFGRVICMYRFHDDDTFKLFVYTPLNSEQLQLYECNLYLSTLDCTPMITNYPTRKVADWELTMPKKTFLANAKDGTASAKITFIRIEQ